MTYLHIITDAFTHEIIDWTLFESLRAVHTLAVLDMTIAQAGSTDLSTLTHHSDRGSQYCYNVYITRLNQIHAAISMTEDHKPTDNAIAERVNGILTSKWLYHTKRPADLREATCIIAHIIDFYNNRRPHMSNNMLTPCKRNSAMTKSLDGSLCYFSWCQISFYEGKFSTLHPRRPFPSRM